jgi:hypothetical protein
MHTNPPEGNADEITCATANEVDLLTGIMQFGLSKYEATAYLTMLDEGSLAAGEFTYYSNLPRPKVYLTLKNLERKKLAVITGKKPLIVSAIPPLEALGSLIPSRVYSPLFLDS